MVAVFIFAGHNTQMIYALSTTIPVDKLIQANRTVVEDTAKEDDPYLAVLSEPDDLF